MSVELAQELWNELKRYVSTVDRADAADTVVNLLIDNDYSIEDIRSTFKGDSEVKQALQGYIDDHEGDDEDEDDYDDDYTDDEDDNY